MRLNSPYDDLISTLTTFYERKIELWQKLIDTSSQFIGGRKPGVDYGKLVAEMPQIRAQLDFIDQALFQSAPLVFSTLTDAKPDSKNHTSRLIITKAERSTLIATIKTDFGTKLNQKNPNYTVGGADVLKTYLLKYFKSSDEPWE